MHLEMDAKVYRHILWQYAMSSSWQMMFRHSNASATLYQNNIVANNTVSILTGLYYENKRIGRIDALSLKKTRHGVAWQFGPSTHMCMCWTVEGSAIIIIAPFGRSHPTPQSYYCYYFKKNASIDFMYFLERTLYIERDTRVESSRVESKLLARVD